MTGITLAKATKEDFKAMWKISQLMQDYGGQFYPDDDSPRAVRMKNLIMARLDQLGSGGFMRIVMGCEMLIAECCDPTADHYALKPVLGAGSEMLEALQELNGRLLRSSDIGASASEAYDSYFQEIVNTAIKNATGSPA